MKSSPAPWTPCVGKYDRIDTLLELIKMKSHRSRPLQPIQYCRMLQTELLASVDDCPLGQFNHPFGLSTCTLERGRSSGLTVDYASRDKSLTIVESKSI